MLGYYPREAAPPKFGPVRFEEQSAKVRRRGRKGLALESRAKRLGTKASRHRNAGRLARAKALYGKAARAGKSARRSRRSSGESKAARRARNRAAFRGTSKRSARRGRKGSRRTTARDYVRYKATRAGTFGPVQFKDQPTWVRRRGKKGTALSAKRRGRSAARGRSSRESKKARRARNRAAFRASKSRGKSRGRRSQKGSRSARRSARKSGGTSVLTYNTLMRRLKGTKNKAWVCVGRKRTGCGGGRKGRRGSRVMGVLRP